MQAGGPRGWVSGAGIVVPGDHKARMDQVTSWLIQTLGGDVVKNKPTEYAVWADFGLGWTLVRPPRLIEGQTTGRLEHDAPRVPPRSRVPTSARS